MIEEDKDCCEVWAQIAPRFDWMKYSDQPEMLTMPHINTGENKYFVNFCPSCGKSARNRNMKAERLLTLVAVDGGESWGNLGKCTLCGKAWSDCSCLRRH